MHTTCSCKVGFSVVSVRFKLTDVLARCSSLLQISSLKKARASSRNVG